MLDNLVISIEAVFPMFIMMAIGAVLRKRNMLNDGEINRVNKIVFKVFFPVTLFSNLYGKDISEAINIKLMLFGAGTVLLIFILAFTYVVKTEKDNKTRGAMIQAIFRSNFIIMGMPVVANMFGSENVGVTAIMITVIIPLYNILAVITLEYFRGRNANIGKVIVEVLKNPLIIGCLSGIFALIVDFKLPTVLERVVESLSTVGSPLAIILLGASFSWGTLASEKRSLIKCVVGRLFIAPCIGISGGILLGFRGVELATLVAIFAAPSAITSFTMAQQMDSNYELAGSAVVVSSVVSCATLFAWIFALRSFGLL